MYGIEIVPVNPVGGVTTILPLPVIVRIVPTGNDAVL